MLRSLVAAAVVWFTLGGVCPLSSAAQAEDWNWDEQFSRLRAVDALGRELPGAAECGQSREGKFVGLFYFLWHGEHEPSGPWDLSKILAEKNPVYGPPGAFHYWAEPELGYYRSSDPYVYEVHAEWLAAARVDTIVIDVTNGHTYLKNVEVLCETWSRLRSEGNPTPQIAFLAHTNQREVVEELYRDFYKAGKYRDLWFLWKGKPLILADGAEFDPEIKAFFTFRKSWAWSRSAWFGDGRGSWAWLDSTPQNPGLSEEGELEQISVSVAQHATTNTGRSYSNGREPPPEEQDPGRGLFFSEQWERALEVDPDFIFITGWNEWVAQRFVKKEGGKPWKSLAGKPLREGDSVFIDAYTEEYSRDIEPMKGGHGRNYYYQMVSGIRRFKGADAIEELVESHPLEIDGRSEDWDEFVEFRDFAGEDFGRDHLGWSSDTRLTHEGGHRDFVSAKVSCDKAKCSFLLECSDPIRFDGEGTVLVLRLVDLSGEKGGFEVRVEVAPDGQVSAYLKTDGLSEIALQAAISGCTLELCVDRSILSGIETLGLRWSDEQIGSFRDGNVRVGDSLPGADFLYPVLLPACNEGSDRDNPVLQPE